MQHFVGCLITGAVGGRGRAEASLFCVEGAILVLTDIDEAGGQSLAQELSKLGHRVLFINHDVADEGDWQKIVQTARNEFGALNVLVNNAGIISRHNLNSTPLAAWNKVLAVNLTGPLLGMKHCSPLMKDSGGGSIVNISSIAGLTAHPDAAYTASKWGLRASASPKLV